MLQKENAAKEERVLRFMEEQGLDFVVLSKRAHFAWLTCGGSSHVNRSTETGVASLVLGRGGARHVLADRIEAPRLSEEGIDQLGYEVKEFPWHEPGALAEEVRKISGSGRVASDTLLEGAEALPGNFWTLRNPLLPDEIARYRRVGYDASVALLEAARGAGPGLREYEIESLIAASCLRRKLRTPVILVAADERIDRYRHPLPKDAPFVNRVMLVLCAERDGLVASLTRFIYLRTIPKELDRRHEAVATVDATAIASSRPGRTLGEVFQRITEAYEKAGYKDEWLNHQQGGPTGYQARDLIANARSGEAIVANQALAWNPSLPGAKSEDTILVTEKGIEFLTRGEGWEYVSFRAEKGAVERPWPLVI